MHRPTEEVEEKVSEDTGVGEGPSDTADRPSQVCSIVLLDLPFSQTSSAAEQILCWVFENIVIREFVVQHL